MAGAALSRGRVFARIELRGRRSLGNVRYRFRGRRSTFARSGADFVAGVALSQGQVQSSRQAQQIAGSSKDFVAGAALLHGQVQSSWQAQHFRKFKHR